MDGYTLETILLAMKNEEKSGLEYMTMTIMILRGIYKCFTQRYKKGDMCVLSINTANETEPWTKNKE